MLKFKVQPMKTSVKLYKIEWNFYGNDIKSEEGKSGPRQLV